MDRKVKTLILAIIVSIGYVMGTSYQEAKVEMPTKNMVVSFIDVGQGNATLIEIDGVTTLVDTGKENQYDKLREYLDERNIEQIDNFVITHPDSDHMGGADLIINDYDVENFYTTYYTSKTNEYKEMLRALDKNDLKLNNLYEGDLLDVGEKATCQVLSPEEDYYYDDSNSSGVVMLLSYGTEKFLLTGDIPGKVEGKIREKYDIRADVLQVSHHGSDYSNGVLFLKNVSPQYAVISVGSDNAYGHPTKNVLRRLDRFADSIFRTDINGNIRFESDGKAMKVFLQH